MSSALTKRLPADEVEVIMEDSLLVRWPRECAFLVPECLGIFWNLYGLGGV